MKITNVLLIVILIAFNAFAAKIDFLGVWSYSAADVPYEYAEGKIYIEKDDGDIVVNVKTRHNKYNGQSIEIDGNQITFEIFVEGQKVTVSLTLENDKLSGKATTVDGQFNISGNKTTE